MILKRIVTGLLSAALLAGTFAVLDLSPAQTAVAAPLLGDEDYVAPQSYDETVDEEGNPLIDYTTVGFETEKDKLKTMALVYEGNGYQLYYEYYTGEVVCVDTATGQMLWSNPYDVASASNIAAPATKQRLISQIILTYELNGSTYTMYSFNEAARKGQIKMKKIKSGIRVEYTMGDEVTNRLVPRLIEKSRYENLIASKIPKSDAIAYARMGCKYIYDGDQDSGFYLYYDISDPSYTERKVMEVLEQFPFAEKRPIYVLDPNTESNELAKLEDYVTKYTQYTYDDLEYDHDMTGYVAEDENPPLFRMALEYTVAEDGLEVRLPANGIRFDETVYKLTSVSVLPFIGAGRTTQMGYTFIPDGSGSLIRFEDVADLPYNVSGQMYGSDYAYHQISGQHAEIMRFPVYGVVSGTEEGKFKGYAAIITEGDTMASLMSTHGGTTHNFNSVYPSFCPRPYDSYNLADSISIGKDATWTVTSSRKYTGSYRLKFVMLSDAQAAEGNGYEASYVGMAQAYRDYLEDQGVITRLTENDVADDIPLYIESFGSIKTSDRFLTIPITVDTALTTFDDVATMYDELSEAGVSNIHFRLRGFANGGMKSTVPYKLNWVDVVGGESGFEELMDYSKEQGFGVYPDFDFAYINEQELFDGLDLKKHAVRTIDNRYTSKRYYDAASQTFENDFALAISPSVYEYFYTELNEHYSKYEPTGISVSTLGSELNSDFDEDDPYNREDSKNFTVDILSQMSENYKVMLDSGNAYTFQYADYILNMATESSKYMRASESVPFIGMVLHGYIQTAGTAINMDGDIESALLRAVENGSGLYFILSYANTEMLKEDDAYNSYYSVGYDTWKEDVIEYYTKLNGDLADLQTSLIVDHEFIDAARVPDADEVEADRIQAELDEQLRAEELAEQERIEALQALREQAKNDAADDDDDATDDGADDDAAEDDAEDDAAEDDTAEEDDSDADDDEDAEEDESALLGDPKYYTVSGTVVRVEYEGGASFILNYNSYPVKAVYNGEVHEIGALDYIRVDVEA